VLAKQAGGCSAIAGACLAATSRFWQDFSLRPVDQRDPNSCHASIGSPIWRKPAAALRWSGSVVVRGIDHDQIIDTPDEGKLENCAGGERARRLPGGSALPGHPALTSITQ
jgi:hypothetical protein